MSKRKAGSLPFFQRYMKGEVQPEDIDDFVDAWRLVELLKLRCG